MVLSDMYNKSIASLARNFKILTNIVHQKCIHVELSLQINYNENNANVVDSF